MKRVFIFGTLICLSLFFTTGCSSNQNPECLTSQEPSSNSDIIVLEDNRDFPDQEQFRHTLDIAEHYRDIYERIYTDDGVQVNLSSDQLKEIMSLLASLGYVASDVTNNLEITNRQLVLDFLTEIESGNNADITIYQICHDAGFVEHKITSDKSGKYIEISRVSWLQDGPFALAGDIPTVTRSAKYEITDIKYSDGYFTYAYYMPDNPKGENHDGHIDTVESIKITF